MWNNSFKEQSRPSFAWICEHGLNASHPWCKFGIEKPKSLDCTMLSRLFLCVCISYFLRSQRSFLWSTGNDHQRRKLNAKFNNKEWITFPLTGLFVTRMYRWSTLLHNLMSARFWCEGWRQICNGLTDASSSFREVTGVRSVSSTFGNRATIWLNIRWCNCLSQLCSRGWLAVHTWNPMHTLNLPQADRIHLTNTIDNQGCSARLTAQSCCTRTYEGVVQGFAD